MNTVDLDVKAIFPQTKNAQAADKKTREDIQKIKKACRDFEAIFTYQLLKTMRQTIPKDTFLGNFTGKDTYNMLIDQKIAEDLALKGEGLGLQKILFSQLTRNYPAEPVNEEKNIFRLK